MAYPIAHPDVIKRAQEVLELNPIFLDTETTGIGLNDVVIEVAIVDREGQVLYDSLVNPQRPIPEESSRVHGITDEMVQDALTLNQVWADIEKIFHNRAVGIYNAEFDMRLLKQSVLAAGMPWSIKENQAFCVMKLFAAWYGEWNKRHSDFKSQKLEFAGQFCGIELPNSHHALDDARLAAAVMNYVANYQAS
ncbi:MAG: 3'-5' exonuclease [Chloroflexi bacterium]|jgi:DNA polymerase III epsilon subunit-like protein|nr:3'-5' exonuclease [Chloroflexota bacterium]